MTTLTLADLAARSTDEVFETKPPLTLAMVLHEYPSPSVLLNLAKLQRLGILSFDALMSLVGQAPIDPINLMGTLMHLYPDGWAFSAIDFSMVRVLARTPKKTVSAALRVDLMSTAVAGLALTQAGQLTIFRTLEVEPGPDALAAIQTLCDDTIAAASRESAKPPRT